MTLVLFPGEQYQEHGELLLSVPNDILSNSSVSSARRPCGTVIQTGAATVSSNSCVSSQWIHEIARVGIAGHSSGAKMA
jgi:hypothetical protein